MSITTPPIDVRKVARNLGLDVVEAPNEDELSGFLLTDADTGQQIIGVNALHHPNRRRFTIAHEIGHFILHRDGLHVDRNQNFRVDWRSPNSRTGADKKEVQANQFAAELLMPTRFVREALQASGGLADARDDEFAKSLAKEFQVSVSAMSFRLANLEPE